MESFQKNNLSLASSAYLRMHNMNPIHWQIWSTRVLSYAQEQNKLILVSIGYASCHWCHVMANESFSDPEVAKVMNEHFITIKVDREEQPDIDQLYCTAVQLMTGSAGWPLNVVCLPDGRPIWGGMYFNKSDWLENLQAILSLKETQPETLLAYASKLEQGIATSLLPTANHAQTESIEQIVADWKDSMDFSYGGFRSNQKFLLANSLNFLVDYQSYYKESDTASFIDNTLQVALNRGLYDKVHGGFMRYCVDKKWRIPHFEKMLYDNALALLLYSNAYASNSNPKYKDAVYKTFHFLENNFYQEGSGYAASQSAVSDDENGDSTEGAYYAYTKLEFQNTITSHFPMFCTYYGINKMGYWKEDKYILSANIDDHVIAKEYNLAFADFLKIKSNWLKALQQLAKERVLPEIDHKVICSWNALLITSLVKMYKVFKDIEFANKAIVLCNNLLDNFTEQSGKVYRLNTQNGKKEAYLDDYAFLTEALLAVYEITQESNYLKRAKEIADYCIANFQEKQMSLFYYTESKTHFATPLEYRDSVMPSSNSSLAKSFYWLAIVYPEANYLQLCLEMRESILMEMQGNPNSFSNWLSLELAIQKEYYVVFINGKNANEICKELTLENHRNAYFISKENAHTSTTYRPCSLKFCKNPVDSKKNLIVLLNN